MKHLKQNGYWDKIYYWTNKYNQAINNDDQNGIDWAYKRLDYFMGRQYDFDCGDS
jgi:hypothetical protein